MVRWAAVQVLLADPLWLADPLLEVDRQLFADPLLGAHQPLFADRLLLLVGLSALPARHLLQAGRRAQGLLLRLDTYSSPPRHSGTSTTFIIIISLSRLVLGFPASTTHSSLVPTLDLGSDRLFGPIPFMVVMVMVVTIPPTTPRLSHSRL